MTGCLPEETYSVYVDGELSADDVQTVESHLVGCESCRALVLALREEGMALADTVLERYREVSRAPARARARGLAIGLVPTLGVAALVVTTLGWLMQILPPGASWLNPVNLIGVYEVTFDTLFTLRDRAPALFDFTVWIGRNVSAAVIIIFLVTALGKRVVETVAPLALLGCLWALLLASPQAASALELRTGEEDMQVVAGETVDETLLISGETVTIDGTIDGDLAAFAERVVLRGVVRGSVFAAAREVEVLGTIEGSLHVAGERVTIEGKVAQNVYGAAQTLTVQARGDVGRDAVLFGEAVHVDGRVGRDLYSRAERVAIRGTVGRDVSTRGNRLALLDGASIGGDLRYQLPEGGELDIAPGARVSGEATAGEPIHDAEVESRWLDSEFYMGLAVFGVSAFLVGMLVHLLVPSLFYADLEQPSDFFRALGYGAVALIVTPIALVLCFITVVGIPIGVIGVFVYLTSLFVAVVAVAALVGTSLSATLGFELAGTRFGIALLVGLVVVLVAMNLPFVGGILRLLVIVTGLGLLSEAAMSGWQARGERLENL